MESYFSFCSYGGVRSWHCFLFGLRCCYLFFGVLKWNSYQHFPVLLFFVWVAQHQNDTRFEVF
jgi:hypothetical protein